MKARESSFVLGVLIVCMSVATLTWGYSGGKGTPQDPYRIADANDLIQLGSTPADQDKHFVLVKDIDLAGRTWSQAVVPVFSGTFDGNNLTIRGLKITNGNRPALFGQIQSGSRVLNISIVDVNIVGTDCAALAVYNAGYVANCQSNGTINGTGTAVGGLIASNTSYMVNCHSSGTISGPGMFVGGLVGWNDGALRDCSSNATVTSECALPCVGGLVGNNQATVSNCFTTGTVAGTGNRPDKYKGVGGLAGWNQGNVVSCYTTGPTTATDVACVGGIVGYGSSGAIANCYSVGLVQGTHYAGGIVGLDGISTANCYRIGNVLGGSATKAWPIAGSTRIITGCFSDSPTSGQVSKTNPLKNIQTYLNAGWDFVGESKNGVSEVWEMPDGGGYPILTAFSGYKRPQLKGQGTADDPYLISRPEELGVVYCDPRACYRLAANIDLSGIQWSTAPIPGFCGTFDGNGLSVRNLTIKGGGGLGLFGNLTYAAQVKHLGLQNVDVAGIGLVGGLAARSDFAALTDCYSTGRVTTRADGVISYPGFSFVGGLVGEANDGSLIRCYSTATVTDVSPAFYSCVGGLVGYWLKTGNGLTMANCYSVGGVTGASSASGSSVGGLVGEIEVLSGSSGRVTVTNCYGAGRVSGGAPSTDGLIGAWTISKGPQEQVVVTGCFWDTQTSGLATSANGTGLTTAQMKDINTYLGAGWDFVGETANGTQDIWKMPETGGYPVLFWQEEEPVPVPLPGLDP